MSAYDKTTLVAYPDGIHGRYTILDSVTSIGSNAFGYCSGLTSITIPDSVTSIGDSAFEFCSDLTSIMIPDSVTSIGRYAFFDCSKLTSITIPDNVTSIAYGVFANCFSLTDVYYTGTEAEWNDITIGDANGPLNNAVIHFNTAVIAYGVCGDNLTWTLTDSGVLNISGTGEMYNYADSPEVPWYSDCGSIQTVVLESGITSIGDRAFNYCSNLTSIIIPDSVTSIGEWAFYNCSSLTGITIPVSVTSVGDDAFQSCSSLTCITIPASVTSIGNYAFLCCSSLTEITVLNGNTAYSSLDGILFNRNKTELIAFPGGKSGHYTVPGSVTSIGEGAFYFCENLSGITIPNGVISIGIQAFHHCSGLTGITIPDGVTSFGFATFSECTGLTSIAIPNSVIRIDDYTFYDCGSLTDVYYAGTEAEWNGVTIGSYNAALNNAAIHFIIARGTCGDDLTWAFVSDGTLTVSGTGNMADYEWSGAPWEEYKGEITSIVINEGITGIGADAFVNCTNLTQLSLPSTLRNIGNYAFGLCESLTSVTLPSNLETIDSCAFDLCRSLGSVTIPAKTTYIHPTAFMRCTSQTAIDVDAGNTQYCSIGGVLYSKDQTILVKYPGGKTGSFAIPQGVTKIGNEAFENCDYLTDITIPDTVSRIERDAFWSCDGLTSVVIPESVTYIGSSAFAFCDSLQTVEIPASVTALGDNVFERWLNHELVNGTVTVRCYAGTAAHLYARHNDIAYTLIDTSFTGADMTLPTGVNNVEEEAFFGAGAKRVKLPEVCTAIRSKAFANCSNLVAIYIPVGCTSIASDVFQNVTDLTIFGEDGSYAEFYANKYGFDFVAVGN